MLVAGELIGFFERPLEGLNYRGKLKFIIGPDIICNGSELVFYNIRQAFFLGRRIFFSLFNDRFFDGEGKFRVHY
jgi:hypothetical protein